MSELLTFEWRRARSIRTTWITSLFTVLGVALLAVLFAGVSGVDGGESLPLQEALESVVVTNPFTMVLISSLAAMAFGHEYRYGTIRLTLTAFPRRGPVFFAKLVITLLLVFLVLAVSAAVGYGVLASSPMAASGTQSWAATSWHVAVFGLTFSILAFSLTVITRNHPLGIIGPLLIFLMEMLLLPLIAERAEWLPKFFPLTAMTNWFAGGADALWGAGVWVAWMVGLLALGFVLLLRRDA